MKTVLSSIAAPSGSGLMAQDNIQRSLEAIRKYLDMDFAYLSEFSDEKVIFRNVDAPGFEHVLKTGDEKDLKDTYCKHVFDGRLPRLIPDTSREPGAMALPITAQVPVSKHVGVPVVMPDGSIFGMFCCIGVQPDDSLRERDLEILEAFAHLAAIEIAHERDVARQLRERVDVIQSIIRSADIHIAYQPLWRIGDRRPVGFECLSRFPQQPYRPPGDWFAEAEELGLGVALELVAVQQALAVLPQLPSDMYLAINVSPTTVLSGSLEPILANVTPRQVVLEITEHAFVDDYTDLLSSLSQLRSRGFQLAVDDAGAGYSCLQHILQLRPDLIKLDMCLTRDIDRDPARKALASALVRFARDTGCRIIAEGVETEAELRTLHSIGVAKAQGYLLGRPMPFSAAMQIVEGADPSAEAEEPCSPPASMDLADQMSAASAGR